MVCDPQLSQQEREAAFEQQRTAGAQQAIRPFSGKATAENLVDYLNREVFPVLKQTRKAVNDVYRPVLDNAPSGNPLRYVFSASTVNADPTSGFMRLDNADASLATTVRLSELNAGLQSIIPWLDVMSGSATAPLGVVTLYHQADPTRFARYDLNTMADQGAYWNLGVTPVEASGTTPFVEGDPIAVSFIPGVAGSGSAVPVGGVGVAVSALGSSRSSGTVVWSNSNNVSFGMNGGTITATATHDGVRSVLLSSLAGSVSESLTNLTVTSFSGATLHLPARAAVIADRVSTANVFFRATSNSLVPFAMMNLHGHQAAILSFINSNNVSWGSTSADVAGQGRVVQMTATATVASTQASIRLSAGTTSVLSSGFTLSDSNGISFGINAGGVVTATAAPQLGLISHVGGNSVSNATRLAFSNASNVTWSLSTAASAATVLASVAINVSAGTTSNNLSAVTFSNANNVSFGLDGSTVTASATVASTQASIRVSAGTTSILSSAFTWSNSNNVSFGINAGVVTATATVASTADPQIGLVSHVGGNSQTSVTRIAFSNASNVTWSLSTAANAVTVLASVAAGGAGGIAASAAGNSVSNGTVVWSNSNNVSFGMAGSTVTATATVASTQASIRVRAGTTSVLSSGFTFSDSNNVSFGINAGVVTATATVATSLSNIRVSAGTTSNLLSAITFSNGGGISFGLNASTITATVAGPPISYWQNGIMGNGPVNVPAPATNSHVFISPMGLGAPFPGPMTANTMEVMLNGSVGTVTSAGTCIIRMGFYTLANSTQLSLVNSCVRTQQRNAEATSTRASFIDGQRWCTFGTGQWSSLPVFSQGVQYWVGIVMSSANVNLFSAWVGNRAFSMDGVGNFRGEIGVGATNNILSSHSPFWGAVTGTTPPSSIGSNQIVGAALSGITPMMQFRNIPRC